MKRASIFVQVLLALVSLLSYGTSGAQVKKQLAETMKLPIHGEGGANGASVAWHPVQKKYYAAMAGNVTYPLNVYDAKGTLLSDTSLTAMFDVRGLWYNPVTKTLQSNGYNDMGMIEYRLGVNGLPAEAKPMTITFLKPDAQSVAVFDPKTNNFYFFDASLKDIEPHSMKDGLTGDAITLHLQKVKASDINDMENDGLIENYNENTLIYTGINGAEIGLLNVTDKKIELYNKVTGLMTQQLSLPADVKAEPSLNFSYCNGIYWVFNKDERVWHGYK